MGPFGLFANMCAPFLNGESTSIYWISTVGECLRLQRKSY